MKKNILSIVTLFQAIFISLGISVFSFEGNKQTVSFVDALNKGAEVIKEEAPQNIAELRNAGDEQLDYWAKNLSSFDGREFEYITPARNQFSKKTCWAFAAVGAVESNILRNGIDKDATRNNLDFDETVVAYTRHTRDGTQDPLLLTTNDTYYYGEWNQGDNAVNALAIMTQGYSLVEENNFHFSVAEDIIKSKLKQSKYYVKSYQQIPCEIDAIKRAILQYGAVTFNYSGPSDYKYYSSTAQPNHASIIVGWNDNVDKSGFKPQQPDIDGAWIIKNSWGNYAGCDEINGTWSYYISYKLPIGSIYAVDMAMREDYQNIYHYDGNITINRNKNAGEAQAAIYEAKLSSPTKQEQLKAVMISVPQDDLDVNVQIYKNLKVNPGNVNDQINIPDQNSYVAQVDAHIEQSGMHTIDLEKPIDLEQGEYFSIVVRCKTKSNVSIPVNCAVDSSASINDMTYYLQNGKWISFKNSDAYADSSWDNRSAKIRAITNTVERKSDADHDLKYARVEIANRLVYYANDKQLVPEINVYLDEKLLEPEKDYIITLINDDAPGMVTIQINGINSYFGTRTTSFEIAKAKYPPGRVEAPITVYNDTIWLHEIPLPKDWKWINGDEKLKSGQSTFQYSIEYVGKDKAFYQILTCDFYVIKLDDNPPLDRDIADSTITIEGEYSYTGQPIIPTVKVTYQNIELRLDIDYTLTLQDNIDAGMATVSVIGKGRYFGQITQPFQIKQADYPFNRPNNIIKVKGNFTSLSEISLGYENWTWQNPNQSLDDETTVAVAIYTGEDKANYLNTEMEITIVQERPKDLASIDVELEQTTFVYDGYEKKPEVIVKEGEKTLEIDKDYTIRYLNNIEAGTASVVLNGINDYSGSITLTFTIEKADRMHFEVFQEDWTFNDAVIPTPTISGIEETAKITYLYANAEDGIYSEIKPTEAGTYWIKAIIEESSNYKSAEAKTSFNIYKADYPLSLPPSTIIVSRDITTLHSVPLISGWKWEEPDTIIDSESFVAYAIYEDQTNYEHYRVAITIKREAPKDISTLDIELQDSSFVYDGNSKTPEVIVKDGNKILTMGKDYEIEYQNNASAGEGKVIVIGKNDYQGTKEISFTISKAEKPNVETTIHNDEHVTRLSDIELPDGFVWEDEDLEITSNKMRVKAIYKGEDAENYDTIEIYFEIVSENIEKSNTDSLMWLLLSGSIVIVMAFGIWFMISRLREN